MEVGSGSSEVVSLQSELLARIQNGDRAALDQLLSLYLPALRRWAHGRLPDVARGAADTDDLVQMTLVRAAGNLGHFQARNGFGLPAYLRRILLNLVRDELRRVRNRYPRQEIDTDLADPNPTPLESLAGREAMARYEEALARLPESYRVAVMLRLEMGLSYVEVGEALGNRSANAARLIVIRAVKRLAAEIEP